jgi:hypothetical protein
MPAKITQGFIDRSGEHSRTQFYVGGGAGDDYTTALADADDVHDAIAVVTLCNFTDQSLSIPVQTDTPTIPSSEFAQREVALWIQYVDTVNGDYGTMSIPGPDLTLVGQANTDEVDIASNVTAAALVVVLEANCVSRDNHAIEVTRMRIIGRRN